MIDGAVMGALAEFYLEGDGFTYSGIEVSKTIEAYN